MEGRRQPLAEINRGNNVAHKTQTQSNKHKPLPTLGLHNPIGKENVKAEHLAKSGVKSKPVTNVKWGPNPNYKITEEDKKKCEIWAREGIERSFGLSGRDYEKMMEKKKKEEEKRCLERDLSYIAKIPDWVNEHLEGNHLGAAIEQLPETEDHLDIVFPKKTLRLEKQYVDLDESFWDEYLEEINSPRLALLSECVWETVN